MARRTFACSARLRVETTTSQATSTCWWRWSRARSLLDLVGLEQDLEALLQRDVDIVTDESVNDAVRDRILAQCRPP